MTPETDTRSNKPAIGDAKRKPATGAFVFAVVLWAHVFTLAWLLTLGHLEGPGPAWFLIGCLVLALPTSVIVWSSSLPEWKQKQARERRDQRHARGGR